MMDSPLAPAEFSRLRKAIQQRERQLAQGLSTTGADLNISRALSNLSLYLPSQTQLAAVQKDWESSDSTKRSQIIIWLQQNLLNSQPSRDAVTRPPPELPPRSEFVAPPPPPPLPIRANTISTPSGWRPSSGQNTPTAPSRPQPTGTSTPTHARMNSTPVTPSRELYTMAALRPPTPPPKDNVTPRNLGGLGRSYSLRTPQSSYHSSFPNMDSPTDGTFSKLSSTTHHSSYNDRSSVSAGTQSVASFSGRVDSTGLGSSQRLWTQATQSASPNQPTSNTFVTPSQPSPAPIPNQFDTAQFISQIQEMSRLYQQNILASISNTQGSGSSTTAPFGQTNSNQQWMEMMAKIQAQQAQQNANFMQQLAQAQTQQSSSSAQILAAAQQSQQAQTNQILAAAQQSQQAQTNQMLSMLQQYQQNTPAFDPSQYLAQGQQQNQQATDILSQMQANAGATPGAVDWASLAGGSGIDATTLISMVAGGTDPTTLATQAAGFMFGM